MLNSEVKSNNNKEVAAGKKEPAAEGGQARPPVISLPKGGGAIRGLGEKFAANPVTGTGSLSLPIAASPGRSGFGPQLALSYDSGSGNGPFGFGWSLSLPSITRKTDKGLPKYQDAEESDVFILSGAEDLVPVLVYRNGQWLRDTFNRTLVDGSTWKVQRYRPRIEGLFARIERWTNLQTGESHWRSISRDNITTLYGKDNQSRIFDLADPDPDHPTRIFSWLICESYDDKGNAIVYEYKEENSDGVDLSQAHEQNRTPLSRSVHRYLKRIKYGNRGSRLVQPDLSKADWMFEVVFDYGEHDPDSPKPDDAGQWLCRHDPFSSYRAGFEVRTYRLCQRVLMFHRFAGEEGVGQDCLVRSTDFVYRNVRNNPDDLKKGHPVASFIASVTQSGYKRQAGGGYLKKSLPPLEFGYSEAVIQEDVREIDAESLENLPYGLDGKTYQWVDLDGEGVSGILTEQADAWFYKPNLGGGRFGPLEKVTVKPSLAALSTGRQQLLDVAGDGQLDLVEFNGPTPGFFERTLDQNWEPFTPFSHLPNIPWNDPNLRFIDLNGDGHPDVLITENEVFTWYPSLAKEGFGPAQYVRKPLDEEKGPELVFADGTQSIYLADISGDGLTDLVRIRNGEVCYWPNLGYGRFGAKVTMDNAPWFDSTDQFDQRRIRLADIDGSGNSDIIYLGRDGVRLYFNQSGNRWGEPRRLSQFPGVDNLSSVMAVDLLGNGTACLVWSSPLPDNGRRTVRYIDLMGGRKPHLLISVKNNLGAETRVKYAPSTQFYLADKAAGKPWITRLPFPVHVVERVETHDRISRNRFVTRYAYHHGYFDGVEREFRGFGMVDQWDTEEFAALTEGGTLPETANFDAASHVPPVLTRTWFHTGVYLNRERISHQFADEYYRELGLTGEKARQLLLDDTVLPDGLTVEEQREACRALKGSMLRQEIYARDGTDKAEHPYTVAEQNFTIERLQPKGDNRHAVFFSHSREAIHFHYERSFILDPADPEPDPKKKRKLFDPRVTHALTLEVDAFGNVLKSASIGYGRRFDASDQALLLQDRDNQRLIHITHIENRVTNAIDDVNKYPDDYRTPLLAETRTYELRKPQQERSSNGLTTFFRFEDVLAHIKQASDGNHDIDYEDRLFEKAIQAAANDPKEREKYFRRLIEQVRTLYRPDDLGIAHNDPLTLLTLGKLEPLALPGESYKLAFTPGLLAQVFRRNGKALLPNPADVLGGQGADGGGYVDLDGNGRWWIPSGRVFLSPNSNDTAAQELAYARQHFFLLHRYRDPFHTNAVSTESIVTYDGYDLLMVETRDPLSNVVTVKTQDDDGNIAIRNDYRVLQPYWVTDPNRNRTQVEFDTLGMVVATAVMGKPGENKGDNLVNFEADLTQTQIDTFHDALDPHALAATLLKGASTRIVHDLHRFRLSQQAHPEDSTKWEAPYAATLARETHASDPLPPQGLKIQISFNYSDGFGREIQKKIQAEPGRVPKREANGKIVVGADGQPEMTANDVSPRWVGSGWTVFNNKGKPVRQYEPFFTDTHRFEFDVKIGVSPVLFYDPVERVVATLHPNHTWEKVVFDPWRQKTFDVNDTIMFDPKTDNDVKEFFTRLPDADYLPTWHQQRITGAMGAEEKTAAEKTEVHTDTPTIAHADSLGRTFLTVAHNKFKYSDTPPAGPPVEEFHRTRIIFDIEGNQREVKDERKKPDNTQEQRIVMLYDYGMLGNRVHQASMEAGERWMLNDVTGKPLYAWDSRGHQFRTAYDPLRRPTDSFLLREGAGAEMVIGRSIYGETRQNPEANNLRGKVVELRDQAGVVTSDEYDFKGNLLRSQRQLAKDYKTTLNWSATVPVEAETYTSRTRYDALNRPIQLIAPHSDQAGAMVNVIEPIYNEANLLEQTYAWLNQNAEPTGWLNPNTANLHAVTNIDYNAKGQRELIEYGNGASTTYNYDPKTFRLTHLKTIRTSNHATLQDLIYTYDPAGNITHIRDDAQQTIYFKNKRVEPSADYTYDAVYRLIEATGREHLGQAGGGPIRHSYNDAPRVGVLHPGDGNAMGRYLERYVYDAVGNFLEMQHRGTDPANSGWTRSYAYKEASLLELGKQSNRLSSTTVGGNNPITEPYGYDAHGSMLQMPQLQVMQWDFKDQLQMTRRQAVNADDTDGLQHQGERTYYVYDSTGQRVRKVTERQNGTRKNERIYLGGFEVYREYDSNGTSVTLERETLHIMDDKQRIALVETRTQGSDGSPSQLIRYQFANHLGSASLELDEQANVISYEEYFPYGSTSYQAVDKTVKAAAKRYRYTGKERDEETGFTYHGARYYAPWLGRWTSCDPAWRVEGSSPFSYVGDNPARFVDPDGADKKESSLLSKAGGFFSGYFKFLAGGAVGTVEMIPNVAVGIMLYRGGKAALTSKRVTDVPGRVYDATVGPTVEAATRAYQAGQQPGDKFGSPLRVAYELSPLKTAVEGYQGAYQSFQKGDYFEAGRGIAHGGRGAADTVVLVHSFTSGTKPDDLVRRTEGGIGVKPLSSAAKTFEAAFSASDVRNPLVVRDLNPQVVRELVEKYGAENVASGLEQRGTIASYEALSEATKGLEGRYQAHHLVEQRVLKLLDERHGTRLSYDQQRSPAVVLTSEEHTTGSQAVHKELNERLKTEDLEHMTDAEIYHEYEKAYADRPVWLAVVKEMFFPGTAK